MANGDTKTEALLNILGNGGDASSYQGCCNTKSQSYILDAIDRIQNVEDEVEELKNNPDVVDIVDTYADLQAYDTQHLTDNDVIRVLNDETHDGESTYYRFTKSSNTWTYIGTTKQYTAFVGTDGETAGAAGLVPAPATTDAGKFLKSDGTWDTAGGGGAVKTLTSADYNYHSSGSTDDGVALWLLDEGQYILDANTWYYYGRTNKNAYAQNVGITVYIKPSGNYRGCFSVNDGRQTESYIYYNIDTAGNNGSSSPITPGILQTTGTSTTEVMSQNATTSLVYADPSTKKNIQVGYNSVSKRECIAIGENASTAGENQIAIGRGASISASSARGCIALGDQTTINSTEKGVMNIGPSITTYGYSNSNYRLLSGVYDGQTAHDAATVGQINATIDAINTALSTNIPHIGASS